MPNPDLLRDDRITTFGLLVEADRRLQRAFDRSLREQHGMSIVWFEAMLRLGRSDDRHMSMSNLADQMVLSSGGVTRLIDRLTDAGYVERASCPSDRRVHWARLTDAGLEVLTEALASHLDDLDRHFMADLTDEELRVLSRVLDRLRSGCPKA